MKIEFSFRYGVVGIYKDRSTKIWSQGPGKPIWRVYPLPFIRVTIV